MAKTTEQKQAEFETLMADNGFSVSELKTYDGRPIYTRTWTKEVDAAWYGKQEKSLEVLIDCNYGIPMIKVYTNSSLESRRGYSSPKRAINALKEIVKWAGFEF